MNGYDPALSHFDLDQKRGAQGELFIADICTALADGSLRIEVKTDFKFLETMRFYIEMECRGRDGVWRPSGIAVTRAEAWALKFGNNSAALIIETEWLRRAVADSLALSSGKNRKECACGENPTRGVVITMHHIQRTRTA